jgi:hypothetical protein
MKRAVLTTLLLVMACVAPAHSQDVNSERRVAHFSDTSRPGLLRVNWESGSITVRTHSGTDVIIQSKAFENRNRRGVLRGIDLNTRTLVEENNNVIAVTGGSAVPADLDIEVPVRTNLSIKALNGRSIVADGVEGEIEVSSTNGNIRLTNVSGSVVADTTNGNVIASLKELAPDRSMSFASMNGNIEVTLPPTAKANVRIGTQNGESFSDFEILVAPSSRNVSRAGRGRNMVGTINGGGTQLDLRAFNGNINVRRAR